VISKKAAKREERRAEKMKKFEESKVDFLARVVLDDVPKVQVPPSLDPNPRLGVPQSQVDQPNRPKAIVDGGSRWNQRVTWCITKSDVEGSWSWGEQRQWLEAEWSEHIDPSFRAWTRNTWAEIDRATSGSRHKMHHSHELDDLIAEAQTRWMRDLNLDEFADSIFRFRLGGTRRAWGYVVQAHFHMVWWERHHRIYSGGDK
jgi:hypothetical protein